METKPEDVLAEIERLHTPELQPAACHCEEGAFPDEAISH